MVRLWYTASGRLILPDPEFVYCPGSPKSTRKVREHLQRVREETIAEHERLKAQVLERIRNQPSARAAAEAAAAAAAAPAEAPAATPTATPPVARDSTERAPEP